MCWPCLEIGLCAFREPYEWVSAVVWSPMRVPRSLVSCDDRGEPSPGGGAALRPSRHPRPLVFPAVAGSARTLRPAWAFAVASVASVASMAVTAVSLGALLLLRSPASSVSAAQSPAAAASPRGLGACSRGGGAGCLGSVPGGQRFRFFSNLRCFASSTCPTPVYCASGSGAKLPAPVVVLPLELFS